MVMESNQPQLVQQQNSTDAFCFNARKDTVKDIPPSCTSPLVAMNGNEMPVDAEGAATPAGVWTAPTTQEGRPRPATIHEGFSFCIPEDYATLLTWDSNGLGMQQTSSDAMATSRPVSMHQDFFPVTTMEEFESGRNLTSSELMGGTTSWGMKQCDNTVDFSGLDTEMNIGQAFTADEAIPVLDLQDSGRPITNDGSLTFETGVDPRRMSGSSFSMSTSGGMSDMPSFEDWSAALSEAPSFSSDYPPPSNRNSLMSSTQLSPVASPRMTPQTRSELVRTQSRGRGASPSPRPGMRSAPYNIENSSRAKRWSTGSYGTTPKRRQSPFVFYHSHEQFAPRMSSRHSSPSMPNNPLPLSFGNLQAAQQQPFLVSQPTTFRNSMIVPSQLPSNGFHPEPHQYETPLPLMSNGLFRMLQSNADPHSLHSHYADLSDPPDLYASLHEEQLPPPPEDMNPEDSDLTPHEQELRFEGDLYTPRWVRGHGNKREGWCGICKPGRWLVLKNSAFWYDKSFTHGISAATGTPFEEPQETRRMDGNPDVWEGLCGSCNDWIALVSSKKKGTTWFRHAYKCHTHPKVKDAPKRRRESSNARALATSQLVKARVEQPMTPQITTAATMMPTPTSAPIQGTMSSQQISMQAQQQTPRQILSPMEGLSNMI